jgi:hypothetical protein
MTSFAKIALGIWLLAAGYFAFLGVTTTPSEGDSLAYHLPIAGMVAEGKWFDKQEFVASIFYYPAMGETLVAVMMRLGLPLNLYNWLGWVLWTGVAYMLARRSGLPKNSAVILAAAAAMWPTVVRLINNQTVDIWLAVWWGAALLKLTKKARKLGDWIWLGIYLGMMAGTKYSGVLFAGGLLLVFRKDWWKSGWRKNLYWIIPAVVIGGFWYVRNWLLVGNPVYPETTLLWQGDPGFNLMIWKPWMVFLKYPGLFISVFVSEYLLWNLLLPLPLVARNRWVVLGFMNLGIFLFFLPSWPVNIVSCLRYTFVAFLPLLIAGWQWMREKGREEKIAVAAVLCMAAELTQLDYRPKMFILLIFFAATAVLLSQKKYG